ncbi:hypothetical protein DPEC_G00107660 [Dallia pectoralis]|uniref:Uncharacterized protein n=1 Tax=Dallia pectoralis TaxID=75939 RepID=A0ACC2GSB4_DALPE|nr:hypothetical protein DPEC_G00107660 [Dallia pectoralis]
MEVFVSSTLLFGKAIIQHIASLSRYRPHHVHRWSLIYPQPLSDHRSGRFDLWLLLFNLWQFDRWFLLFNLWQFDPWFLTHLVDLFSFVPVVAEPV